MKLRIFIIFILSLFSANVNGQVGIGTNAPDAQLDIRSSNQTTPANNDGLLIPKVDAFPAINPTIAQQSMLVYLTTPTTFGGNPKSIGFYYWDNSIPDWVGISSSVNGDHDWYKVGSTTAPMAITDDMFHTGNIAIGKNNPTVPLDVENNTFNGVALFKSNFTTSDSVVNYHSTNDVVSTSDDILVNNYNILSNNGTGLTYGIYNIIQGTGTGNQIGLSSNITNSGNNPHYGTNNILSGAGTGSHYGYMSNLNGAGTGNQFGYATSIANTGVGIHYGLQNNLSGTGTGIKYGLYNNINSTGGSNQYGSYSILSGGITGDKKGHEVQITNNGSGTSYGLFTVIGGSSTNNQYGVFTGISNSNDGSHYGSNTVLSGTGIGSKYGTFNKIETTAGGNHYGIFSEVLKPGITNFAGYFLGNVTIGTTSTNNYIFPPSRGTNGQIMKTDGSGILSWANNSDFSWSLLGNGSTSSATNFLGTTDDIDLVFRRFNARAGFIGNPNTATGNMNTSFGALALNPATTGNRNSAFGANALNANTTGTLNVAIGERSMFLNTTGSFNTAVGVGTLYSNVSGDSNTAIGRNALTSSTSSSNTAIGRNALQANSTGDFNTGIGRDSMFTNNTGVQNAAVGVNSLYLNSSGGYNAAMGVQALRSNSTGSNNAGLGYQAGYSSSGNNNVFLGNQAGYSSTGNGNVFIGSQAGYNETLNNNKLYIENSNANADNALIYGEFDNNIVRVNGTLQISNPASAPGYSLPIVRGTAGQVLQTDGAGTTSWANSLNSLSVMRSNLSANQALSTAGWQKINFDTVVFDTNNELNTGSSRFTALRAGYYQVNAGFHTFNQFDNNFYAIGVFKNGSEIQETGAHHFGNNLISRTINCIVYLAVGDYVEIFVNNSTSGSTIDSYSGKTYFEVNQIR